MQMVPWERRSALRLWLQPDSEERFWAKVALDSEIVEELAHTNWVGSSKLRNDCAALRISVLA